MNLMLRSVESQCVSLLNILDECYLTRFSAAPICIHAAHTEWFLCYNAAPASDRTRSTIGPIIMAAHLLAPIAVHEELVEKQLRWVQFIT